MSSHGSPEQERSGEQTLDLIMTLSCAAVAGAFGEQAYEALANHIPEAGVAASGLGFIALVFTGLSIYSFHRFRNPPVDK